MNPTSSCGSHRKLIGDLIRELGWDATRVVKEMENRSFDEFLKFLNAEEAKLQTSGAPLGVEETLARYGHFTSGNSKLETGN